MFKPFLAAALGCATLAALAPAASAQTSSEQRRWDDAQRRFDNERQIYDRERQLYDNARARDDRYRNQQYQQPQYQDDRFATNYDAARYYRDDPRYTERSLGSNDRVYRGSDGRYYCQRTDGTTGLIIGGAAGGVLGNVIDGGRNRAAGTLIGGALGALLGRSVEQNQQEVRCR